MHTPERDSNSHVKEITRIITFDPDIPHLFKVPLINLCHIEQTLLLAQNYRTILEIDAFVQGHTERRVQEFKRFLNLSHSLGEGVI